MNRPNPFPSSYEELVFDGDNWSQTIIVDGKRPEWLLYDDRITRYLESEGCPALDRYFRDTQSIRVRRREPKRETVECFLIVTARSPSLEFQGTIDLIDGEPDLSTLKIGSEA